MRHDPSRPRITVYDAQRRRRRRWPVPAVVMVALLLTGIAIAYPQLGARAATAAQTLSTTVAAATADTTAPPATATASDRSDSMAAGEATTAAADVTPPPAGPPSAKTRLRLVKSIGGDISPKSVVSSGSGFITAQNMMYRHSVTVYDARTMRLITTIDDRVDLSKLGYPKLHGMVRGAPVEGAFSPDAAYEYVTNYSMYGAGFGPEGTDTCTPASGYDRSFTYRINTATWKIDRAYQVGVVPKVVKTTADGKYVLVSNWCSWDLSVISTAKGRVVRSIPIGAYPRGIALSPKGNAAYVAVMGGTNLVRVDLKTWKTRSVEIGSGPRAIEFSPDDRYIYATLNAEGNVARLDLRTRKVVKVATGQAPRSLTISTDGTAIYVVNYDSASIAKIRTRDMRVLQTIDACVHPIGITYDAPTRRVWVACYGGALLVYRDH